jgi:hypothetical protein
MNLFKTLFGKKPPVEIPTPEIEIETSFPSPFSKAHFKTVDASNSIPDLIRIMDHNSGYKRQAAIKRAVALRHSDFFPAIAARLNDWVPQVRDAARAGLITLLPLIHPAAVLPILPALANLRNAGRHDHAAWLDSFESGLIDHLALPALTDGVLADDKKIAHACFDLIRRHSLLHRGALVEIGLLAHDIGTNREAAMMIGALTQGEREPHFEAALRSRFGAVRVIGLRGFLNETGSLHKQTTAIRSLLDSQSSVRAVAIAWLTASGVDVRGHCHRLLALPAASARDLRISLATLGALRQADDAVIVRTFTSHLAIAVREAAYAAWLKLAESEKDVIASKALGDAAERIKKMAMEMVTRHGAFIAFATACALLARHQDWPRLMRIGGNDRWNVIEAVARLAPTADAAARTDLGVELESWASGAATYHRPTAAQAEYLRSPEANAVFATLAGRDLRDIVERELSLALAKRR